MSGANSNWPSRRRPPASSTTGEVLSRCQNRKINVMKTVNTSIKTILLAGAVLSLTAAFARANFDWENLQSDINGVAENVDSNLLNPWGMAMAPSGNIWVADNHAGVASVYFQDGSPFPNSSKPLVVTIPNGDPTGVVYNGTAFFKITKSGPSQPARFIFVSEAV